MRRLEKTKSLCPQCHQPVDAYYVEEDGQVFLRKTCQSHGEFNSLVARNVENFVKWTAHPVINIAPKRALTKGAVVTGQAFSADSECPLHCGTCENHLQTACCVLIDVTDRCNQHCPYCFAQAEADTSAAEPTLAEIERKYDLLLDLGEERPFNIQLSGGEPTVRDDLPEIIRLGRQKGFEYIQINSNGRRLAEEEGYAETLMKAGASVIFMQFDGTTDEIYKKLRHEPLWEMKKKAIEHCRKAGLPVTLVPTVVKNVNLDNVGAMMDFLLTNVDIVKGIHFQPVSFFGRHPDGQQPAGNDFANRVTMFDIMHEIEKQTDGRFHADDFCPITTGHPLCCFYGTFQKRKNGTVKSLISTETKAKGVSCCDTSSPLEIIKKDRDFVLNKWNLPMNSCCCDSSQSEESEAKGAETCCCSTEPAAGGCCESDEQEIMDFDQFLKEMQENMFTVSAMAFQDESNLDAERLKRCRVQVLTEDDRLIPFCAYNSIYRNHSR